MVPGLRDVCVTMKLGDDALELEGAKNPCGTDSEGDGNMLLLLPPMYETLLLAAGEWLLGGELDSNAVGVPLGVENRSRCMFIASGATMYCWPPSTKTTVLSDSGFSSEKHDFELAVIGRIGPMGGIGGAEWAAGG